MNKEGKVVIPFTFTFGRGFHEGLARVVKIDENGLWAGFIDKTGKVISKVSVPASEVSPSAGSGAMTALPVLMPPLGHWILALVLLPEDQVGFHNGLALSMAAPANDEESPCLGFIDRQGKFVISPVLKSACQFTEGLALVSVVRNNKTVNFYIDTKGKGILTLPDSWEVVPHEAGDRFDVKDSRFSCGLALIKYKGKYGFINQHGDWIVRPKYDDAAKFSEGLAYVEVADSTRRAYQYAFIDTNGRIAIPFNDGFRQDPRCFHEGLCPVETDKGEIAYIDKTGAKVFCIPAPQEFGRRVLCGDFSCGRALITDDRDASGFIDHAGKWIVKPRLTLGTAFSDGVAAVGWRDPNDTSRSGNMYYGLIDINGKFIRKAASLSQQPGTCSEGLISVDKHFFGAK